MSKVRYPHTATGRLEDLEPLNSPRLHDRIYDEILVGGLEFRRDHAEEHREGIQLLGTLMDIHREYSEQAGPFRDLFGEYLENSGQTSERAGQFFTPPDIVDMMVRSMLPDTDLGRPEPFTICDPACGTGRFMLRTAAYFAQENQGALNFLFTNVDVDRRVLTYATMNAILSGIPGVHIHGDTLRMEVWDAFATIPIGSVAMWERVRPDTAKALIEQSLKTSVSVEPVRRETVQTTLGAIT